jgi:hypothetical protein
MTIRILRTLLAGFLCILLTGAVFAQGRENQGDEQQIVALLKSTFDQPQAPLVIAPVVIEGDHAIAGWTQDKRGGRALMRRAHGKWTIHLCSGDPLKHADMLTSTGIPAPLAKTLADKLAAAERAMPPATIALFATFEGVVHIGADGQHPPAHHRQHGHHPPHK